MFGHNQTQDQSAYNQGGTPADVDTTTHDPASAVPSLVDPAAVGAPSAVDPHILDLPGAAAFPGSINQPAPAVDDTAAPEPVASAPIAPDASSPSPAVAVDPDLLNIKQQALQHLSPLVNHLDQTPEERFRTTMMMIQATDDQTKIKAAYEAAQQITDEKIRAQALLDVVNEINYFTQQHKS